MLYFNHLIIIKMNKSKPIVISNNVKISFFKGFSLIEILIVLVLASSLLFTIEKTYLMLKKHYLQIEYVNQIQNRMLLISNFLQQKISMTGFIGCGNLVSINLTNNTEEKFDNFNVIQGFSSNNLPENLKQYSIVQNTDVLVIKKANDFQVLVTDKDIKRGSTTFHAKQNPATPYRNILLLSNCRYADLFIAENIGGTLIKSKTPFAYDYTEEGQIQVAQFEVMAFFISKNNKGYGLYYAINNGNKQRLFDDIKDLKISYGVIEDDSKIHKYLSAQEIWQGNLWNKVVSVIVCVTPYFKNNLIKPEQWSFYIKLRQKI